jgi:hypothetical protein
MAFSALVEGLNMATRAAEKRKAAAELAKQQQAPPAT